MFLYYMRCSGLRRYFIVPCLIVALFIVCTVCQAQAMVFGRGMVVRTSFAVGGWGIISEKSFNGSQYFDPVFLPFRFRHDGLRVWFLALLLPSGPDIQMWGRPLLLLKMMRGIQQAEPREIFLGESLRTSYGVQPVV
jgi:hypothetical protein